ncbi:MAG: HTH-type transcriptional regulator DmlR [Stenotrophomonas maltophilia]|uniref:HTH-type transcriptional regulator DmlR n=1 Tax=Stenotrophomonas maltophilia TaxID=40324 RepID=A0A7V8FDP5_STEMA|nr:MAG: HTH-type transcriptional regulator DmlR [Stenotrophomonas maltophilia]
MKVSPQLLEGVDAMAAVVDARSFGGAAETLGMSQSGVSRAIARLEARLGIRVFERTTRSVRLTDEGRRFYEEVMPLIDALVEATGSAAGNAQKVSGRLRVNIDPFFTQVILGPRLGAFMDMYPELEVELRSRDELGDLVADGFDLAIRFGHPQSSTLVARKLLDTRVFAVASPAYLERHGHPVSPRELELQPHRCILFREPVSGRPFAWNFHHKKKRVDIKPHGMLTVNDSASAYASCLAGLGVAQLFELGLDDYIASNRLVQLFPDWSDQRFPLYAYYPSRHHVPAKTRALLDYVSRLVTA